MIKLRFCVCLVFYDLRFSNLLALWPLLCFSRLRHRFAIRLRTRLWRLSISWVHLSSRCEELSFMPWSRVHGIHLSLQSKWVISTLLTRRWIGLDFRQVVEIALPVDSLIWLLIANHDVLILFFNIILVFAHSDRRDWSLDSELTFMIFSRNSISRHIYHIHDTILSLLVEIHFSRLSAFIAECELLGSLLRKGPASQCIDCLLAHWLLCGCLFVVNWSKGRLEWPNARVRRMRASASSDRHS